VFVNSASAPIVSRRRIANRILARLDDDGYKRLIPHLELIPIKAKQVLYRAGQQIDYVYFPENAVVCLLTVMQNGQSIESADVGREGACWFSGRYHLTMPSETVVAIAGNAYRLSTERLDREMKHNQDLQEDVIRYIHARFVTEVRTAACNGLHSLQERCARWILTTLDRIEQDSFSITHDFLAQLLGANRPSVSVLVEAFERFGMVKLSRGMVTVADRGKLEGIVCECYFVIRDNFNILRDPLEAVEHHT
jgi:CRP-like cAMP-binding protein